jgi:hypothetical protein
MAEKDNVVQIGRNVLNESDLLIQVQYEDEEFVLKFPNPLQKNAIDVEVARRLGGLPRSAFSPDRVITTEAFVTVDTIYVADKCPKWFVPWTCMDEQLILKLYNAYLSFRDEFAERLRTGRYRRGGQG